MFPYIGFGLGLRAHYYQTILDTLPPVDWFEIMTEDYFVEGGRVLHYLDRIMEHYPNVTMHGVSLSVGSIDPLNKNYLKQVKQLADRIKPQWISDHLCWTGLGKTELHDLLPLPYTEEAIKHVADRVKQVQDILERPILLENVSSYVTYQTSVMPEWEFLTAVAEMSDCYILLDINNIYVSGFNHQFDPLTYLNYIPVNRVKQFHLAGHDNTGECIVDTHDDAIAEDVWQLYKNAVQRFPKVSTLIERDDNFPPFEDLLAELDRARAIKES